MFINEGVLVKSGGTAASNNFVSVINSGELRVESGTFRFLEAYSGLGELTGAGTFSLDNNDLFSGTVSPGLSPGKLSYIGDFSSAQEASLKVVKMIIRW